MYAALMRLLADCHAQPTAGERQQRATQLWRWMYYGAFVRSLEETAGAANGFGQSYRRASRDKPSMTVACRQQILWQDVMPVPAPFPAARIGAAALNLTVVHQLRPNVDRQA